MKPRLKRTIEPIDTPEGDLILMRTIAEDVTVGSPGRQGRELIAALDGASTVPELEQRFGEREVRDVISQMQELNLIEDAADDELIPPGERERFDRQLRYFSDVGAERGLTASECQQRLSDAEVTVLGVGGLGGRAAWELASCGVGTLRIVDFDRVEKSNLNRQIQYGESDIGKLKVDAFAARLRDFNSEIEVIPVPERVESEPHLAGLIAGADLVIEAADWPAREIEQWCNSACFAAGIPYIAMSQFPPFARVGPLYVPGRTGCFACQEIAYRREYPLYDVAAAQTRGNLSPAAALGPVCGVVGALVGAEAVHFLTGLTASAMLGTGYIYDLRTLEPERYEVVPEPECEVCAHLLEAVASR
jgi:bacteriocin biosynthesis cyclodehydratase domain-containing protein